jgi:hypothetical protein
VNRVEPPYGELWKVARVDTVAEPVTDEQRAEACAWLESLGIPYRECRPTLVITQNGEDKRLLLHLAQMQTDSTGAKVVNHAENVLYTVPLVVQIDKDSYPAWLVQASHIQDQATKEVD